MPDLDHDHITANTKSQTRQEKTTKDKTKQEIQKTDVRQEIGQDRPIQQFKQEAQLSACLFGITF
jgi:hypothetical protein